MWSLRLRPSLYRNRIWSLSATSPRCTTLTPPVSDNITILHDRVRAVEIRSVVTVNVIGNKMLCVRQAIEHSIQFLQFNTFIFIEIQMFVKNDAKFRTELQNSSFSPLIVTSLTISKFHRLVYHHFTNKSDPHLVFRLVIVTIICSWKMFFTECHLILSVGILIWSCKKCSIKVIESN